MAEITYDYRFGPYETKDEGKLIDVVKVMGWTMIATNGERPPEEYSNRLGLPAPGDDFVPFEKLTKELSQEWLEKSDAFDLDEIRKELAVRLETPPPEPVKPTVSKPAPFEQG